MFLVAVWSGPFPCVPRLYRRESASVSDEVRKAADLQGESKAEDGAKVSTPESWGDSAEMVDTLDTLKGTQTSGKMWFAIMFFMQL